MGLVSIRSGINSDYHNQFLELSVAYQKLAAETGVELLPFRDPGLPLFNTKTDLERRTIIEALSSCVRICELTLAQGQSLNNTPALIWTALKEFGLRPPSDFFAHMKNEHVIEIHSPTGIQFFRSFSFYRFCSYSLEELYCGFWDSLYTRNQAIIDQLMVFLKKVYQGEIRGTVPFSVPPHVIREVASPMKYEIELSLLWGAPLFEVGTTTPAATIEIESVRFAGSNP